MPDVPKYWVGGAGYISPSGGTCVAQRLVVGDNVIAVSVVGTLLIRIPGGLTGHVHGDGTCNVTGDPAALTVPPNAASTGETTITTSGAAGNITVTLVQTTVSNITWISSWSAASGGIGGASVPTSADTANFDANSFTAASQTATVDAAFSCLNMDWTGATNTPTFAGASNILAAGSVTFIADMVQTYSATLSLSSNTAGLTFTAGGTLACNVWFQGSGATFAVTLQDNLNIGSQTLTLSRGTLTTGNKTITAGSFVVSGASTKTLTPGSSTINLSAAGGWNYSGSAFVLTANTATINISGTGAFVGGNIATYNNINLNGTSHTVSGAFTCAILTRNGTATKTDSVTFTSGTTVTCTTCAMIGNSATNRLLVQSSTLGSPATITATNWTGTVNCDVMDITATNAINLAAITGLSGDCGGNTGITFTTTDTLNWKDTDGGSWSDILNWTKTAAVADRVPLPQDTVTFNQVMKSAQTITVDMPRIGGSVSFAAMTDLGTDPVISLSNDIENYGSFTLVSGLTYTHNNKVNHFRGRGNYTLTSAGKTVRATYFSAVGGKYTLQDDSSSAALYLYAGELDTNNMNVTTAAFYSPAGTRILTLGSSIITLNADYACNKWNVVTTGFTLNAGTSTIILTNSTTAAQSFIGAGLTYNNVTVTGAGNYALTITGNNTFNVFTVDRSVAAKTLTGAVTCTVASLVITPVGTTVVTITNTAFTLSNLANRFSSDYLSISGSNALPTTNKFYAGTHSTNGGSNTGWVFDKPPVPILPKLMAAGVI